MPLRRYKEVNKNKSKTRKAKSKVPWTLPLGADVVIDHSFFLELPGELQNLPFLLMVLLPVSIPLLFQMNPRPLQCPRISGHVRIKNGVRNTLFISGLYNHWQYGFIRHPKLLGMSSDPLEVRLHRKGSLWSQLMGV